MEGGNPSTEKPPVDPQPAPVYPAIPATQGGQQAYPQQGAPQVYPPQGGPQAYPQGQQPYAAGYPPPGTAGFTVVTTQPTALVGATFRETPVRVVCSSCNAEVVTSVDFEVGLMTWLACLGICGVGLFLPCVWLGCCFIPFCVSACKDAIHKCPNCQAEVGRYKKI